MARTIIISDTHIPRRGMVTKAGSLEPLIDACDRIVINGDLAETHKRDDAEVVARELEALQALLDARGCEPLLLCGNHDPEISTWRAAEFGGGRILVTHGDAFHSSIAPWAREARIMRAEWRRIQALHPGEESIQTRFDSVRGAAIAEWWHSPGCRGYSTPTSIMMRPWALVQIIRQWQRFPEMARKFARCFFPDAEWLVVGHCHRRSISRSTAPGVINTGAFGFPTRPLAVCLEDDVLEVRSVVRASGTWRLKNGEPLLRERVPEASTLHALHGPPETRPAGSRHIEHVDYPGSSLVSETQCASQP